MLRIFLCLCLITVVVAQQTLCNDKWIGSIPAKGYKGFACEHIFLQKDTEVSYHVYNPVQRLLSVMILTQENYRKMTEEIGGFEAEHFSGKQQKYNLSGVHKVFEEGEHHFVVVNHDQSLPARIEFGIYIEKNDPLAKLILL